MKKILATILTTIAFSASAQFTVATGDAKAGSTYSKMFQQLSAQCPNIMTETVSTGSVQNVELLTGNQVNAAIVQTDMLFYMKSTDPDKVANVRTVFTLHPEELHFIARADTKTEGGVGIGSFKIGGNSVTFTKVGDLKDRVVGAVGGSVISGRIFSSQSGLNFAVQQYPTNDALKTALLEGKVDTILVVGGAPHSMVQSLDTRYRILAVDSATQQKVAAVYKPTKVSYTNLNQAGVNTVATQANFVTRVYRSNDKLEQLKKIRNCFNTKLGDIQDTTGSHPKWQVVNGSDKGNWTFYELN